MNKVLPIFSCLALTLLCLACSSEKEIPATKWSVYRGDKAALQYSSLAQINTENVRQLEVAWTYRTGGNTQRSTIQCNPIVVRDRMFLTSPDLRVIALEAATGQELWQFDPDQENIMGGVNRGVTYWTDGKEERILFTGRHFLYALDAHTGQLVSTFGEQGRVDMRQHLGIPPEQVTLSVTSPGIIYQDLIILGSAVGEGYTSTPGHIRAYRVQTGKLAWVFHTIPQPGELGYEEWEQQPGESFGGANAWGGLSLDEQRGWVFAATGSIAFDFFGGRRKGENLFANCVLALNAETGKRIWHYQVVRHDLWDWDLPCAPNLATIEVNGQPVEAVIQPTKMGYLFLLDRETGRPLYPVEEYEALASNIPGETAWPTQPLPTFPDFFVDPGFGPERLTDLSDEAHTYASRAFKQFSGGDLFCPPSLQGSLSFPGTRGGAEWSGASFDPETGVLYLNVNEIANILKLKEVEVIPEISEENGNLPLLTQGKSLYQLNCTACHGAEREGSLPTYPPLTNLGDTYQAAEIAQIIRQGKGAMAAFAQFDSMELHALSVYLLSPPASTATPAPETLHKRYVIDGYRQFRDQEGYPANRPPWGSLVAINLNTGKRLWKKPLGEFAELTAKGIPPTGTQNLGGCVATAGGLVFVGASKDEKFRAFDKTTGNILWEYPLPYGGYATPAIYEHEGIQYIVIACGGGGKNGTKSGDMYIAFNLGKGQ